MTEFPSSYYDDLRGRLRAVLFIIADEVPASTFQFVTEELDANELGVAFEAIVDALVESGEPVSRQVVTELDELERSMQVNYHVWTKLSSSR